jgi:hypothetical protein
VSTAELRAGSVDVMKPTAPALLALALTAAWIAGASGAWANAQPLAAPAPQPDWSEPPDFEALRAQYVARSDFAARCEAERPLSPAFEAARASRWDELLALTEPWTVRCPVDMEAHTLRALALGSSGHAGEAANHEMWARGLFEAALASGDGKTPATAYRVIAEFEEYALLRAFRYPPERQAKAENGTDRLTVRAAGEEQTLYFEVLPRPPVLAGEPDRRTGRH